MENNQMISFGRMLDTYFREYVYIPLIQRNYKWNTEIAAKLASDLWKVYKNNRLTYTIGMISFYREEVKKEVKWQLIDGQQRIITLFMILKAIKSEEDFFNINFERDDGISSDKNRRINYLKDIANCSNWKEENLYTDIVRFKENYEAIKKSLKDNNYNEHEKDTFATYIRENVYVLMHIFETQPFDEFLNLNKYKTRFIISDRIKAKLIIDAKDNEIEKNKTLDLFQNLSQKLFAEKNLWELISLGYCEESIPEDNSKRKKNVLYTDENRLKLLCCERYGSNEFDVAGMSNYDFETEFDILNQYDEILKTLKEDIDNKNWNAYNAFKCLYELKDENNNEIRFFNLIKPLEENFNVTVLEKYFIEKVDRLSNFKKACFIEFQTLSKKLELNDIEKYKCVEDGFKTSNRYGWYNSGSDEYETFKEIYNRYIKQKYEKIGEL